MASTSKASDTKASPEAVEPAPPLIPHPVLDQLDPLVAYHIDRGHKIAIARSVKETEQNQKDRHVYKGGV
jgi:hypothetical protein